MSRPDIARRARLIIIAELACSPSRVTDNAEFVRDLGADSLDMIGLPLAIEEEFGIILSDDEVAFAQTVGTAIDLIETKVENRACGAGPSLTSENRRAGALVAGPSNPTARESLSAGPSKPTGAGV